MESQGWYAKAASVVEELPSCSARAMPTTHVAPYSTQAPTQTHTHTHTDHNSGSTRLVDTAGPTLHEQEVVSK